MNDPGFTRLEKPKTQSTKSLLVYWMHVRNEVGSPEKSLGPSDFKVKVSE